MLASIASINIKGQGKALKFKILNFSWSAVNVTSRLGWWTKKRGPEINAHAYAYFFPLYKFSFACVWIITNIKTGFYSWNDQGESGEYRIEIWHATLIIQNPQNIVVSGMDETCAFYKPLWEFICGKKKVSRESFIQVI